jgi:hypothetical protein
VLADEAVALLIEEPHVWFRAAVLPAVPLAVLTLIYVQIHRTVWVEAAWEGAPLLGSVVFGLLLTLAYVGRGVGHGRVARLVVTRLHPTAPIPDGPLPALQLALGAAIGAALAVLGAGFGLLPGLFIVGYFADLPGAIAVEGRGVAGAAWRPRPSGTLFRATRGAALGIGVFLLVWFNLLVGAALGVGLLRSLMGIDPGLLAAAVSPTNGAFLAASAVAAFVLVEPFWSVMRALLYLDVRLGRSGADLTDRWAAAKPGAASVAVLVGALFLASPTWAQGPLLSEVPTSAMTPEAYAHDLAWIRSEIDDAVTSYDSTGWEGLGYISDRRASLSATVAVPGGGSIELSGELLLEGLPDQLHSDSTREDALATAQLLRSAEEAALGLRDLTKREGPSGAELLDEVLAKGDYEITMRGVPADRRRQSLRDRVAAWWQALFVDNATVSSAPRRAPSFGFDIRWLGAASALLALAGLLVFLGMRFGVIERRPSLRGREGRSSFPTILPDARSQTPTAWSNMAHSLVAEGRLREAVRAHYLAALAALDRRREIDYRPEHTNGALIRGYRGAPEGQRVFVGATERFERAWYGEDQLALQDVAAMETECAVLVGGEAVS